MNSRTKILVIPKELAIAACVVLAALIILLLVILFRQQSTSAANESGYTPASTGVLTDAGTYNISDANSYKDTDIVSNTGSDKYANADSDANASSNSDIDSAKVSHNKNSEAIYTPGVYTASITIDNSPVSVKVTVDADNINAINLTYTDEAITTMYPMLSSCFNELAAEVCSKNSTKNISYSTDNRYTAAVILKGIEAALEKAYSY